MNARLNPTLTLADNEFAHDVLDGLSGQPKTLPCKWFYDLEGSDLFEQITRTPEYYSTRVETRLLQDSMPDLARRIADINVIVEPGSGSSIKTRLLLSALPGLRAYVPIDISAEFLMASAATVGGDFPHLAIEPLVADFSRLEEPFVLAANDRPLVFFPGSTIGNFAPEEAATLLREIRAAAGAGSSLLIGVDMTQDAERLVPAYDDAGGVTAAFNRNILVRANRELGADFVVERFSHRSLFNRSQQRVEMHLVSEGRQTVTVLGKRFDFEDGETIHTENAYKYPKGRFIDLAATSGWRLEHMWQDSVESAFAVMLFRSH